METRGEVFEEPTVGTSVAAGDGDPGVKTPITPRSKPRDKPIAKEDRERRCVGSATIGEDDGVASGMFW